VSSSDFVPRGYRLGPGRVLNCDQNSDRRPDAIETAGCDEIYVDKAEACDVERQIADYARPEGGSTVVEAARGSGGSACGYPYRG
jgi:hypothetical protein